jgi:hypothetical protein
MIGMLRLDLQRPACILDVLQYILYEAVISQARSAACLRCWTSICAAFRRIGGLEEELTLQGGGPLQGLCGGTGENAGQLSCQRGNSHADIVIIAVSTRPPRRAPAVLCCRLHEPLHS